MKVTQIICSLIDIDGIIDGIIDRLLYANLFGWS